MLFISSGLGGPNTDISDSHNLKRIVFIFAPLPIFVPWLFLSPPTIILPIVPSPASCEMNPNSEDDKRDKTKVGESFFFKNLFFSSLLAKIGRKRNCFLF